MIKINIPATPSITKFQRPTFGNGRYYTTTTTGAILAFGAPVALPFACSAPVDFGDLTIGSVKTMTVTCTTKIAITAIRGLTIGKTIYQAQNSTLPTGVLPVGASFSFPVTFNLTNFVLSAGSTSAPAVSPGVQTTALSLYSTNGVTGYSTEQPITLTGVAVSSQPFLSMTPLQLAFPGIVIGSAGNATGTSSTFLIQNLGKSNLTIKGYSYHDPASDATGDTGSTNVTLNADSSFRLGPNGFFSSQDLPAVGTSIPAGGSIAVHVSFSTQSVGSYFSILTVWSDGGSAYTTLTGSANTSPIALLERSTNEGGWQTIPDCAVPDQGCVTQIDLGDSPGFTSSNVTLRLNNNGGSALVVTKSKPPLGVVFAANPNTDFPEGFELGVGKNTTAVVFFQPGASTLNSDPIVYSGAWTLNTNDLLFGVHVLNFTGRLVARQDGPRMSDGSSRFKYLGCYQDSTTSRIESTSFAITNNTNGACQQKAMTYGVGVPFAGTEFQACVYPVQWSNK
jgi:hypothetical protein